jgi:hypothetical protein
MRNDSRIPSRSVSSLRSSPNTAALKSAVIRAVDRRTGDPVVLKYWEKTGTAVDGDFKELRRHEMRQSERVRAFPRGMKSWPKYSSV